MGVMGEDTDGFGATVTTEPYNTNGVFHLIKYSVLCINIPRDAFGCNLKERSQFRR